ncbi:Solute carrier family 13 member 5 [Hondaea fermentalgiana]|uniref:Solute carrier family 13 member 5 n=1 Tax=Hondaea fermentalgiana TaxID=2315210 RepID=A0A2R5GQK7_9STRA|nr:Solute carrier family 13 member 5 [Hondaea fermentalgiana]|eukprot:GBG30641.1 Solute carrier family 13 member 5 [Hondaea fermentalgiana]
MINNETNHHNPGAVDPEAQQQQSNLPPESFSFSPTEDKREDEIDDVKKPEFERQPDAPCWPTFTSGWWNQFSTAQKIGLVGGPLLAIIACCIEISDEHPDANEALGMTILIVFFWIFEVVPIPVTSLMPLVLYPLAGVQRGRTLAGVYYNHVSFLFLGAFLVVLAIEEAMAHKRFALWALKFCGTKPRLVLLGFMLITGLVSMFASNTSTTILMLPVIKGFLEGRTDSPDGKRFEKASLLGIAFAATTGGTGTIIGTIPNLVFSLLYSGTFPAAPAITFQNWMAFAFPIAFIMLFVSWGVLCLIFLRGVSIDLNAEGLARERRALGPMTRDEMVLGIVLALMVLLWLIRPYAISPFIGTCAADTSLKSESACEAIDGNVWTSFINDGTIAIIGGIALYFIPSSSRSGEMLLTESAFKRLPWGVVLLLGAGFAIANAVAASGLSTEISYIIVGVADLSPIAIVAVVVVIVSLITELISNAAAITLFGPILLELAVQQQINPLLLGLPATVAASLAFVLPTATPPSAIAFASGKITFYDMAKGGIFVKIIGIVLTIPFVFLTGKVFGDLNTFPEWAQTSLEAN